MAAALWPNRPPLPLVTLACFALLAASACSDDTAPADTGPPADIGVADLPDAGACPAAAGPTEHKSVVTVNETWRAADSPHVVTGLTTLSVKNATLTIEPCAVVLLDDGVKLFVDAGGKLLAEGDAQRPIRFSGLGGKTWGNLRVQHPGYISLSHVTIQDAGEDVTTYDGASLVIWGDSAAPLKKVAKVVSVTVDGSAGYGALVGRWGGFTDDSSGLTITGSGSAALTDCPSAGRSECGEPLRVQAQALGTIPVGAYTGNANDEVCVEPDAGIQQDTTVRDRGLPLHIVGQSLTVARAASRPSDPVPTLTVEAGVALRFDADAVLRIGFNNSPGALHVKGTAGKPVIFTSAATTPAAGDWRGIWFDTSPGTATNSVAHAQIAHAGGKTNGTGFSCPTVDGAGSPLSEAAGVTLHYRPDGAFITDSTVSKTAGHGVVRGWSSDLPGPDFTAATTGNTFEQVAYCAQTNPKAQSGTCASQTCP